MDLKAEILKADFKDQAVHAVGAATKRNTVRVLRFLEIPGALCGETIEICFRYRYGKEAVAIKVYSMSVLFNLSLKVPEIAKELKITIEDQLPYGSAGFTSRAEDIEDVGRSGLGWRAYNMLKYTLLHICMYKQI